MNYDDIILDALRRYGPMTNGEIVEATGIRSNNVSRSITRLRKFRFVKLVWGNGRGGSLNYYAIWEFEGKFVPRPFYEDAPWKSSNMGRNGE